MSAKQVFLALFFDAPLVSFGDDSKFDRRDTLGFPSRGAVTGLVAAALGIGRNDRDALAQLAALKMSSIVYMAFPGTIITDYHTVGGGYSPGESRSVPVTASGKSRGTVLTDRRYLACGKFAAVLSGDDALARRIGAALQNPVWGGWIGRKHCIPAVPVFQGGFETEEAALDKLRELVKGSELRIYDECAAEAPGSVMYSDLPVDFAAREFLPRTVLER